MKRARPNRPDRCPYVTKGGLKLEFALRRFAVPVEGVIAADLGCHRGGFTDCLLSRGARRVHAVDTAYGILDWRLRNDPRVVIHERTNLLYWNPPEPLDLAVIDAGWTRQRLSVGAAVRWLTAGGKILSLVKPQYEADRAQLVGGVLPPDLLDGVLAGVRNDLSKIADIASEAVCPFPGSGGNSEAWLYLSPLPPGRAPVGRSERTW